MLASTSRPAAISVALAVLLSGGVTACDFNPMGAGNGNWGFGIQCPSSYTVTAIGFIPADTLRIRVGDHDSVEVRLSDPNGDLWSLCRPPMTVTTAATGIATSSGPLPGFFRLAVRGIAPGLTVLRVSSGGNIDSLAILVSPRGSGSAQAR